MAIMRSHTHSKVGAETGRAVHDFISGAVANLPESLENEAPEWELESRRERGPDGHFREHAKRVFAFWRSLNDGWLRSLPDYGSCIECLKSDAIIGPHLGKLVGTNLGAAALEADNILWHALFVMLNDEGAFSFSDEQFEDDWQKLVEFFSKDHIPNKLIAPLPHLAIQDFPLHLSNDLALDRLTDNEVSRCCQVGVLRPLSQRFPLIVADEAVGIRKTVSMLKVIRSGDEPHEMTNVAAEGTFGSRPPFRDDLVIDDVLSALRLFKHTQIQTSGHARWTESFFLSAGISYRVLRQWPHGGKYELSEGEVPQFLDHWRLMEEGAARFGFSIHRFNLAFERGLLADRIVDLVIAAESLFLGDLDVQDRGELRFRFALRAAKFIEHPTYSKRDVFRLMRRAYDARSAIVHGGSPRDTRLPENESANLPIFIDAMEELVRLGLRKALSMKEDGNKLRHPEYWNDLVLL